MAGLYTMTRYLYISLACFAIAIIAFLHIGCAGVQKISVHPSCAPKAICCAQCWHEQTGEVVEIAVSHIKKGVDHAQAVAHHHGGVRYLVPVWDGQDWTCKIGERQFDVWPYRYVDLDVFIDEQQKARK